MAQNVQLFFYQKSNLMKEAPTSSVPFACQKTRNGITPSYSPKLHERGDKVVVNGAKQSLLAILRKHTCQCLNHNLDKMTLKFLSSNKITASYDILVWMLIFLRKNCELELYSNILKQYISKMQKKKNENENHQSQKYIKTKKQTIQKFINSAQAMLTDFMNQSTIQKSVAALYSKGKSRDNALNKIVVYLKKINFYNCLSFQQSSCSFKMKNHTHEEGSMIEQQNQKNIHNSSSDNFEDKIQNIVPHEEKPLENILRNEPEDYPNISQRQKSKIDSYDLFDQLIREEESAYSLQSEFFFSYQ